MYLHGWFGLSTIFKILGIENTHQSSTIINVFILWYS